MKKRYILSAGIKEIETLFDFRNSTQSHIAILNKKRLIIGDDTCSWFYANRKLKLIMISSDNTKYLSTIILEGEVRPIRNDRTLLEVKVRYSRLEQIAQIFIPILFVCAIVIKTISIRNYNIESFGVILFVVFAFIFGSRNAIQIKDSIGQKMINALECIIGDFVVAKLLLPS